MMTAQPRPRADPPPRREESEGTDAIGPTERQAGKLRQVVGARPCELRLEIVGMPVGVRYACWPAGCARPDPTSSARSAPRRPHARSHHPSDALPCGGAPVPL